MKKLFVMLTALAAVFSLSVSVSAAPANARVNSSGTGADVNRGDLDWDDDDGALPPAPAEEARVEIQVDAAVDRSGRAVKVTVAAVTARALAAGQPAAAAKLEETRAAVSEIRLAATPAEKEAAVSAYFGGRGAGVKAAVTAAIAESAEVTSLADIEPVAMAPVKVESAAFRAGGSVTVTIAMPARFEAYGLSGNSFVCAELVDGDGIVHIVIFRLEDGRLVGDLPAAGVIGCFWVGSSVTAPQTGNTGLEGMAVCGTTLCAAVLLLSVKRLRRA